ncbi:hypothetical protein [Microbacterium indicum]|uniref:hypothetical protein n=1 Tax=Microbacterium indicum TaxID=358100 RepID=UPI00049219FD|nr:hypothetical protein [Microbacterium indicum]
MTAPDDETRSPQSTGREMTGPDGQLYRLDIAVDVAKVESPAPDVLAVTIVCEHAGGGDWQERPRTEWTFLHHTHPDAAARLAELEAVARGRRASPGNGEWMPPGTWAVEYSLRGMGAWTWPVDLRTVRQRDGRRLPNGKGAQTYGRYDLSFVLRCDCGRNVRIRWNALLDVVDRAAHGGVHEIPLMLLLDVK